MTEVGYEVGGTGTGRVGSDTGRGTVWVVWNGAGVGEVRTGWERHRGPRVRRGTGVPRVSGFSTRSRRGGDRRTIVHSGRGNGRCRTGSRPPRADCDCIRGGFRVPSLRFCAARHLGPPGLSLSDTSPASTTKTVDRRRPGGQGSEVVGPGRRCRRARFLGSPKTGVNIFLSKLLIGERIKSKRGSVNRILTPSPWR